MPPPWNITTSAIVDTGTPLSAKWNYGTTPVSVVSKFKTFITIPAFDAGNGNMLGYSVRLCQFNYTVSNYFTLSARLYQDLLYVIGARGFILCIRYRKGLKAYRYQLNPQNHVGNAPLFSVPAPNYTGQIIAPNFCIEVWTPAQPTFFGHQPISLGVPMNILTSLLVNESILVGGGDTFVQPLVSIVTPLNPNTTNDLYFIQPPFLSSVPINAPINGPWLDNA